LTLTCRSSRSDRRRTNDSEALRVESASDCMRTAHDGRKWGKVSIRSDGCGVMEAQSADASGHQRCCINNDEGVSSRLPDVLVGCSLYCTLSARQDSRCARTRPAQFSSLFYPIGQTHWRRGRRALALMSVLLSLPGGHSADSELADTVLPSLSSSPLYTFAPSRKADLQSSEQNSG